MKTRLILVVILLGMLAGCTDTADSISREYRNQINEGLDAMMLVTNEATAKRMNVRVFKPMGERFTDIDRRLGIVRANRAKKEFVTEFFESDSVHMYIGEIYLNRKRFELEVSRLKNLSKQCVEHERELHKNSGKDTPFDANAACPNLLELASESPLASLSSQLKAPKVFEYFRNFADWKVDNLPELLAKHQEKLKKFAKSAPAVLQ